MNINERTYLKFIMLATLCFISCTTSVLSADNTTSPLTKNQQSLAKKGNSYARSGKAAKAETSYQSAIDQAISVEQCLALIQSAEHYGSILTPVRRNCLDKAMRLSKSDDDYFQIIVAARQCQMYEFTKQAIDELIARATTSDALLTLAHKAQSMALNDIAHIALEKLYRQAGSSESKLAFAKQAKLMAMDDLMRKAVKDMLDAEPTSHGLCTLLTAIEPLEVPDLERKILRKAVYQVATVDDCKEVYEAARRLGQQDVVDLAGFKGRKMMLMQQAQAEQEAIKQKQEAIQKEQELKEIEASGQSPPPNQPENKPDSKSENKSENNATNKQPNGPGF